MSDADVKANIAVSTDVEKATQKTNSSVVSMAKQFDDVQKKFSTAGKDIFLGFFAPMAIFQTVLGFIQQQLGDAKQRAQEGYDMLVKGDTVYATSEQKRRASYVAFRIAQQEEEKKVKEGAQKVYEDFLNTKEGEQIYQKHVGQFTSEGEANLMTIPLMAANAKVRKDIEDWFAAHPELIAPKKDAKDFKGPEGFSNVVGVGANPVLETMTRQTQIQEEILEHLKNSMPSSGQTDIDFTKVNPNLTTTA